MSLYKRGGVWWYRFKFQGVTIRESSGLANKQAAGDVERKRHLGLKECRAEIVRPKRIGMFSVAADGWFKAKKEGIGSKRWAPKTAVIEDTNLSHLKPIFGGRLLSDVGPELVQDYCAKRRREKAADKTISLEIGTLRAIMLFHDLDAKWRTIRKKIKLEKARNIGRMLAMTEETALLTECRASRSRSLPIAVTLALQTCMRSTELRLLQWRQVDFARRVIKVGDSKTEAGTGREIPMTNAARQTLTFWAQNFPNKKPNHYVFPAEQYGGQGKDDKFGFTGGCAYDTDPTQPIGTWKEAWEAAKERAGVECRWHDLRHTGCTRLLEAGVSHPIVAEIMGWSASTTIRMIKEVYGHIGLNAKRRAIEQMEALNLSMQNDADQEAENVAKGAQKGAQSEAGDAKQIQ
jgi:integrase